MHTAHEEEAAPPSRRPVLFMVEWTPHGPRMSHCQPSEALTAAADREMRDRTAPNLPEIGWRMLQGWFYAYSHGEWSRGEHR